MSHLCFWLERVQRCSCTRANLMVLIYRKHCSPSLYWNSEMGVYFLTIKTCELKLQHEDPWPPSDEHPKNLGAP